ncbi:tetratricopeptide repeat protein [Methylocapsa acidiphila]|uniref:tetratricopeptide repeat protein n=1 Tax=Methylocapsa acidiphila TaxID=133552 RepID=UPI0018DC5F65|nr:tetratricopeptide repeat protein [Methylocapsa acidiphila]
MSYATDAAVNQAIDFLSAGRSSDAIARLRSLNAARETRYVQSNVIGLIYLSATENAEALAWFDRALQLNPHYPEAHSNRGCALQQLDRDGEALASYEEALRLGLAPPELFYNRGNLLREAGRLDEAIASYDSALKLNPAYPEALCAGGRILRDLGHPQSALEFFDEALRLKPHLIDALIDRGNALQDLDRPEDAIRSYDLALAREPNHPDLLNNRGAALHLAGRLQEADADFTRALRLKPQFPQALSNHGNLLLTQQRPTEALASFDNALALKPRYAEAFCGRALALQHIGRFGEALESYDRALDCDPSAAHFKNNKAALLLLQGDFAQGWDLYEWRWISGQTPKHELKLPIREWRGESLSGRSIMVFDEQGNGDAIQFARFFKILADREANVVFFCRNRLHRLFRRLETPVRLIDDLAEGERFDFQIALCSLPRTLDVTLSSVPTTPRYLTPEPELIQKWAARISGRGFKVGVCWRGNPAIKADPSRSIPLAHFATLAEIPGARLISLQKLSDQALIDEISAAPWLENPGFDFDAGPDAFIDAAALMQSLDLIVTCDTSIAHLAGALGRPVWVMLKQTADWRWLRDRDDSPWYPSMRLFRQSRLGDWSETFGRAAQALRTEVEGQSDRIRLSAAMR